MSFSLDKKHIIVVYHHVDNPRADRKGIHPCSVSEFEKQIKFLSKHYRIASISDVYNAAKENDKERVCALTFDDGLLDNYKNAVPIMEKYDATGTFFIIGSVFDGTIPFSTKLHIILSNITPDILFEKYHVFLDTYFSEEAIKYRIPTDKYLNEARRHDDIRVANFKDILIILPEDIKEQFLKWFFKELNLDEKRLCEEFFMSEKEVKDLHTRGFTIGGHTESHQAFDCQSKDEMKKDISSSRKLIKKITGERPVTFSYPHGRLSNNISDEISILKGEGFEYAVTTRRGDVKPEDSPFLLPRYNTNEIRDFIREN